MDIKAITKIVSELLDSEIDDLQMNLSLVGLDSMKVINLIVKLEEEFDIIIEDNELLFENFSTILRIMEVINPKLERAIQKTRQ